MSTSQSENALMFTSDTRVCATSDHVSSDLAGEEVILNLANGTYYGLNEVGSQIWTLVQTPQSVNEICTELQETYDVDPDVLDQDVRALLAELHEAELIEVVE